MFNNIGQHKSNQKQGMKKKPPPRPPPPNFNKLKSRSAWNLSQLDNTVSLIDLSPPNSPRPNEKVMHNNFGGSAFSSFSSSTSSLASSKKSFEYDLDPLSNNWPSSTAHQNSTFYISAQSKSRSQGIAPTIIRPQPPKPSYARGRVLPSNGTSSRATPPMPTVPPPSPPKGETEIVTPYGIALYDFTGTHPEDLSLQANDIVILHRRINNEWFYGQVEDREGIFPVSFVDVQVPLPEEKNIVMALYDFQAEMPGDLQLKAGQSVKVLKKISADWLYGECNGQFGQFPVNFVNRVPKEL